MVWRLEFIILVVVVVAVMVVDVVEVVEVTVPRRGMGAVAVAVGSGEHLLGSQPVFVQLLGLLAAGCGREPVAQLRCYDAPPVILVLAQRVPQTLDLCMGNERVLA